jgi:ribosome-associated protein
MDVESIRSEIAYRFSRSSGPGGQHANKSSTRAEAIFDVEGSQALTSAEKRRILERAGPVLRAVAQDERSQLRNRELAADRIVEQLRAATYRPRARTPTKPSKGAREQRLDSKHRRAGTKRLRGRPADDS